MGSNEYVKCYNCHYDNPPISGVDPIYCPLCDKFGDGKGKLLKKYSLIPVEVEYINYNGIMVKKMFNPPFVQTFNLKNT